MYPFIRPEDSRSAEWGVRCVGGMQGAAVQPLVCWLLTLILNTESLSRDLQHTASGAALELATKVKRRFAKVSIVFYSRPSLMIIASASQFHIYLPWDKH